MAKPNLFRRVWDAVTNRPESAQPVEDKITPSVKALKYKFQPNAPTTRSAFAATQVNRKVPTQDYDLSVIDRFVDNESIVFQTFSKIEEKATNNGYQFVSKDQEAVDYIRRRLAEFGRVAKKPTDLFVWECFGDLVKYSNCFLYKFRDMGNSSGRRVTIGDETLDPIASYVRLDPTSVIPERDEDGNVIRYHVGPTHQSQFVLNIAKKVPAQDIIHIYDKKNPRNNLGTPYIWPVIDDIRVLRHMEENLEMLIHKHLFPLYQYIVGTDDMPPEPEEIEKITLDIENIPSEGGWVTPNRHKVEVIGAEGKAMDVSKYLNYFRERVVMGLGIGLVSFGLAAGASRSSSEVIDRNLVEKAKRYQNILSSFFNDLVVPELLAEGGWDILDENYPIVTLDFNEIDSETQIKVETNALNLFNSQLLDYDEARTRVGMDVKGENDVAKLQFNMFGAAKEQEFNLALAHVEASFRGSSTPNSKSAGSANSAKAQIQPSNQHGVKSGPKRQRDEHIEITDNTIKTVKASYNAGTMKSQINQHFDAARADIVDSVKSGIDGAWSLDSTPEGVRYAIGNTESSIYHTSKDYIASAWDAGYSSGTGGFITDNAIRLKANEVLDAHAGYVKKTMTDIQNDVINILTDKSILNKDERARKVSALFDLKKHYINDAVNTGIAKAFNHGRAHGFKDLGHTSALHTYHDSDCEKCKPMSGKPIDLSKITVDSVAPHHLNCECSLDLYGEQNAQ